MSDNQPWQVEAHMVAKELDMNISGIVFIKMIGSLDCRMCRESLFAMRVFPQCAALLISLLIPVAQMNAQTQAAMNAQARAEFEKTDAELNKTYEAVLKKLPDDESKQKLKESQRAWLAFRDAEAAFAADEAHGGTMAPTLRYATMTELTQQRIKQLNTRLTD